jgi:hypothetical protein
MIPKWREKRYTDDGCSLYECLNCKNIWESRSTPEYGWKFCPYCGIEWVGEIKGRPSGIPRWRHEFLDKLFETDYDLYLKRQSHLEKNRRQVESRQFVWLIEWNEKDYWHCEQAFSGRFPNSKLPVHQEVYLRMLELRKEEEQEEQERIKFWEASGYNIKQPKKKWRIRVLMKFKFEKEYPRQYVQ